MKVCGYDKYSQLIEKSNKKSPGGYPIICPPCDSHLNISSLSSFSACDDRTIWITNEGQGYAVGYNEDGRILGTHIGEFKSLWTNFFLLFFFNYVNRNSIILKHILHSFL